MTGTVESSCRVCDTGMQVVVLRGHSFCLRWPKRLCLGARLHLPAGSSPPGLSLCQWNRRISIHSQSQRCPCLLILGYRLRKNTDYVHCGSLYEGNMCVVLQISFFDISQWKTDKITLTGQLLAHGTEGIPTCLGITTLNENHMVTDPSFLNGRTIRRLNILIIMANNSEPDAICQPGTREPGIWRFRRWSVSPQLSYKGTAITRPQASANQSAPRL